MADLVKTITEHGLEAFSRFYSSYRGVVVNNEDPEHMNRIRVAIPGIMGGIILWALPKGQCGGEGYGFKFLAPRIEDIVYITFENGDPSKPLWEYHGWSLGQIPDILDKPNTLGLVTPSGNMIYLDDDENSLNILVKGRVNLLSEDTIGIHSNKPIHIETKEKVIINQGNNKGVVNILELTDKLNSLVQQIEELKETYNTHTHPGISSPTTSIVTKLFDKFNYVDYEDSKLAH